VRRRQGRDQGNVTVFVLLVMTTIIGVGAMVVDVGSLYAEGRQLQNGAEAGALAVAATCATTGCDPAAAAPLADANAGDDAAAVKLASGAVCGTAPGLTACSGDSSRPRFGCRPVSGSAPYVEVRTTTRNADGTTEMPPMLARLVGVTTGTEVGTCARAAYGAPTGLTSQLPLTISYCDWSRLVGESGLSTPPPYPPFPPSDGWFDLLTNPTSDHVRVWSKTNTALASPCTGPAGQQLPGGFGWIDTAEDLNTSATGCAATTDTSGNAGSDPGASTPSECNLAPLLGQLIYIPIFDTETGTGNTASYHIMGYAAFYMTGYSFTGGDFGYVAPLTDRPCTPSEGMCISGYFTAALVPSTGGSIGGPSMGVTIIRMTG
jgi:Flp pilus assembly protein TadG